MDHIGNASMKANSIDLSRHKLEGGVSSSFLAVGVPLEPMQFIARTLAGTHAQQALWQPNPLLSTIAPQGGRNTKNKFLEEESLSVE
jgi:hypothetical protein